MLSESSGIRQESFRSQILGTHQEPTGKSFKKVRQEWPLDPLELD